jgi:uncharacterized protein YndB with AHSA1/START domain
MTSTEAVACEMIVEAPPEEVYRWFIEPERLVQWIGGRATLEPRPGGIFRFEIVPGEWCSGRYVELTPGHRVVFTWGWESGAIPVPPGSSTVSVSLNPHPRGTLVHLEHTDLLPEARQLHMQGWSRFLPRLAAAVAGRDPGPDPAQNGLPPRAV